MRILRVCFLHTFATCFAYSLPAASIAFPLGSDCAFSGIVMAVVQFRNSLVNSLLPFFFFVISCDFWFFWLSFSVVVFDVQSGVSMPKVVCYLACVVSRRCVETCVIVSLESSSSCSSDFLSLSSFLHVLFRFCSVLFSSSFRSTSPLFLSR
jgi:hypothetical protein